VSASSFNPRVARLLERIAEYPNIPRKKAKFEVSLGSYAPPTSDHLDVHGLSME